MKLPKVGRSSKIGFLAVALALIFLCAFTMHRIYQSSPDDDFCTTKDGVYQEIHANLPNWIAYFFTVSSLPSSTRFEVQGRPYIARADLTSGGIGIFYVSTAPSWPSTLEGLKGYLYTASGQIPSDYWPPAYEIEHLVGNIYCYSEYEIR
jgi:hypothetical protein